VHGLSRRYGRTIALDRLDLSIGPGQVCLLLGANGAGKSTLLRILEGVIRPDAGHAAYGGREIGNGPWQRRRLTAGIGHRGRAYPLATVRENLDFVRSLASESTATVAALLVRFDLEKLAGRPAAALSAGQRQRLELALAVARSPELLLLDEPFAGLDAASSGALKAHLADLPDGVTVILTTHDPAEVWALADRVVVLREGRLVSDRPAATTDPARALAEIDAGQPQVPGSQARSPTSGPPGIGRWRDVLALSRMDLAQAWRSRRDIGALLAFAVLIMLTVSLALQTPLADSTDAAVGGFWASMVFATVTGAQYGFPQLRQAGSLELLLALPVSRPAVLISQTLTQLVRLLPTALAGLAAASFFFEANLLTPAMVFLAGAGALALASVASAYGALLAMVGGRAVLGPLLMLPATLPVVLAGVLTAPVAIGQTSVLQTLQAVGLGLAYAALIGAVSILAIEEILVE
jgi:ABC-type multidrug transport system ATPase subunit/ABC-type transport system involved in cytochrome c biogenesis permease component